MRGELEFILKNIDITRPVPRMRTIPQVKKEFPELQLSERYLRSLVREHKVFAFRSVSRPSSTLTAFLRFLMGRGHKTWARKRAG